MDEQAGLLAATGELAGEKQLRRLESFTVHEADNPQQAVGLDTVSHYGTNAKPVATGTVLPADGASAGAQGAGDSTVSVTTGPIIDWCFEFGDRPAVWIITKAAWYRLCNPSTSYSSLYDAIALRLELAVRCASALAADPTAAAGVVRHRVLTGQVAGSNGTPVHPEQLSEAAGFLAAQMATLHQAGALLRQPVPGTSAADVLPFVGWLKQEGAAVAAAPPAKRQRLADAGQTAVTATAAGVSGHQPLSTSAPAAVSRQQPAPVTEPAPAPARAPGTAAATAAGCKPTHKLKINFSGSGLKPKIKLKGQILPQLQPPPQDMGSQIQGHPPELIEGQALQQGHRPKLKFVMSKGGLKQQEEQQQLQHQESWQFSDAQGGWGPPPPYPSSAVHGATQHQRPYDYACYDYYDEPGHSYQQPQHLTARQQQRAAAAAAKQAAVQARATAAAARAEEQARRRQQRLLELEMQRQAEITADIARGPPPAPTRSFRLPEQFISDLLILWELCQAFGGVLNVPPFSLEQLEAALLPGPLTDQQRQQSAAVTGAAADAEALKAAQEAAAQLAAQLAQAAAAADKAALGEQPARESVQLPGTAGPSAATSAAPAVDTVEPPAAVTTPQHQPGQQSTAAGAAGRAQIAEKVDDPGLGGSGAAHADVAPAVGFSSPPASLPEQPAAVCDTTPRTTLAKEAPAGDAAAVAHEPPTAAAAAASGGVPADSMKSTVVQSAAVTTTGEAVHAASAGSGQQPQAAGAAPASEQPALADDSAAAGTAATNDVLPDHGATAAAQTKHDSASGPDVAVAASTLSERAVQQVQQQSVQQPQTTDAKDNPRGDVAVQEMITDHHLPGEQVEVPQVQQVQQQVQSQEQALEQGQLPAEQPTPPTGDDEQSPVDQTAAVSIPKHHEAVVRPADQQTQQPQQHQVKQEPEQAQVTEVQGQCIVAADRSSVEHIGQQTGACHAGQQGSSEHQQGQQGPSQAAGEERQEEVPTPRALKAEQVTLQPQPQHGQDGIWGEQQQQQQELMQEQQQPHEETHPLQEALQLQQQNEQQQQTSQQQQASQQQEQCHGPEQQQGPKAAQQLLQSPFAGQPPAPSTTSVGTGQAAASNSVGAAPYPAKHKLKLKVKLGGMNKQSSSQLQQSTSGVTTAVTAASGGAMAVDPATAAAVAAIDPAAAAAAAATAAPSADAMVTATAQEEPEEQQIDVGITDRLSLASSVILRDLHSALLRLVDGTAPKPGKKPPKQPLIGKLCPGDTNQRQLAALMIQPHWAHRAAYALSAAACGLLAEPHFKAKEVSSVLLNSDYTVLPLEQRMSVLRCLLELALASDTLRAHIDVRIEAYAGPKAFRSDMFRAFAGVLGGAGTGQRGRPKGSGYGAGYGMNQLSAEPSEADCEAAAAAAERSIGGRMVDEWMEWITQHEQQSSGFRRPLGVDYRGRHYWVLGGAAGAWRVFVEEQEGLRWGYYEGQQLLQLINWLACAAIEAEVPLLHTLCTMPWPYHPSLVLTAVSSAATAAAAAAGAEPPTSPGSIAYWANVASGSGPGGSGGSSYGFGYCFTPLEAGVEPLGPLVMAVGVRVPDTSQLMGVRLMQRLRPDGYRKLAAPLMLGEAGVPGGSVLGSCEERISASIASLVAVLPFWLKQQQHHILQQLGSIMDDVLVADSPAAYCQVVLSLERLMSDTQVQPAPLSTTWTSSWQQVWRDSLTASGPGSWEAVLLHLAMLGRYAVVDEFSLGRDTFMRIVTNSRCPTLFPAVGDTFMLLRSACLKHLDKYSQLPPKATAPLPPAADELTATAAALKRLPPVSCYKVVALAYCSYPMPEGLKQQQRQQVAAAAAADTAAANAADGVDAVQGGETGAGASLLAPANGGTAAAANEPGMSDDWPGLAALGDDGVEEIDSLWNVDIDELDIDTLPGQMHQQQHQQQQQPGAIQAQQQHQQQEPASSAACGDGSGHDQQRPSPLLQPNTASGSVEYRPPCMWALMSPQHISSSSKAAAGGDDDWQQPGSAPASVRDAKRPYIAVPFHVDPHLPDCLVSVSAYESSMERSWLPGDKFSMYIGGKRGQKTGGQYYKGTVMSVEEPLEDEETDPWCSIEVLWDNNDDSSSHTAKHKVSPWDIEADRDEARKAEEAARKQQQAAAAAEELRRQEEAAAEARARRRASRTVADYSDLIGAVDDDDEYNPLAEGYSSDSDDGRRRRGRKGKRGRGSDDEDFKETAAAAGGGKKSKSKVSAPTGGTQWSAEQIKQQQSTHLPPKQQQMLGAMATGNTLLLARLTSAPPNAPIHQQPFPLPLKPGVLCALPNADSFFALVGDYISSANRNFSRPTWGQRELDLYTLFLVVNVRGGYEAVCRTNRWEDVCRSMGITLDPSSGSNMRTHYEKCLVEFEQYIRCGRFEQDMAAGKPPTAEKSDTDAAFEQVMRAGAAAAAAPPPPPPAPPAPRVSSVGVAGVGLRPQLIGGAAGGLMQMPGVAGLQPGTTAILARNAAGQPVVIQATPQQLLALQLAQQQQLMLAKQHGKVGATGAPMVLPAGVPAVSAAASAPGAPVAAPAAAAATAAAQQQLLLRQQLLQQAQLQSAAAAAGVKVMPTAGTAMASAANPQLKALLQQQAAAIRPAASAPVQLAGGLTLQQLQALQAQQLQKASAVAGSAGQVPKVSVPSVGAAPGAGPAASTGLPPRPPGQTATPAPAPATSSAGAQNALAGTGSMNFSALLDDL